MKPRFLVFVAIVVAAVVAYQKLPGLRARAESFVNEYGAWTPEAIDSDPAGFIAHAQKQLDSDITTFEQSKTALLDSKRTAETKLAEFTKTLDIADTLAEDFKARFQAAKAGGSFPIEVVGKKYTETDAIKQVEMLLAEKSNAQKRIEDYTRILAAVETKRAQLTDRISQSRAKRDELVAQEQMVKLDKLTADADKLLAQVNSVVEDNGKLAAGKDGDGDPVRSLSDMMKDIDKLASEAPKAAEKSDALAFLND
jgi:uncharacterized glyoxalase superfamily protein PhnB